MPGASRHWISMRVAVIGRFFYLPGRVTGLRHGVRKPPREPDGVKGGRPASAAWSFQGRLHPSQLRKMSASAARRRYLQRRLEPRFQGWRRWPNPSRPCTWGSGQVRRPPFVVKVHGLENQSQVRQIELAQAF